MSILQLLQFCSCSIIFINYTQLTTIHITIYTHNIYNTIYKTTMAAGVKMPSSPVTGSLLYGPCCKQSIFSMQLILVVGMVDIINQICQMLSFCWKLLSASFAEKKWLLSTLQSTVVTAKCACIRNTNVCFFECMHADQVGQHFNLRPNFEL